MNIVVHYPKGEEKEQELRKRVAVVHSSAILKYIERLPCPREQKKEILFKVIEDR